MLSGFVEPGETPAAAAVRQELVDARWFSRAEIQAAIADGSLIFPPSVSISRQLIWSWLQGESAAGR